MCFKLSTVCINYRQLDDVNQIITIWIIITSVYREKNIPMIALQI